MNESTRAALVDDLLKRLSPAEKAGQLTQYFYFGGLAEDDAVVWSPAQQAALVEAALARGGAGSLLFVFDPAQINRLQRLVVEGNRHGIPALFGFDVIHGLRTIFPVPIGMAASWDPDVVKRAQAVAAREARAIGLHWTFAPMVDIARDPRWGRIVEGAGEDPVLGAAIAAAQVRGFQGEQIGAPERVVAGPKHFAGYGAALGGRDYDEVSLSDHALQNVYLPSFRAAVDAGAGNVMSAYMALNGVPATGNRRLLTGTLRDDLGFGGFVVSDANAVRNLVTHGFAADLADAAARAVTAGCDMEMTTDEAAFDHLTEAVEQGRVPQEVVDAAVRRVLDVKARMGLLDGDPYVDENRARTVLADPRHRDVAQEAAERSAVLLHNADALLPLAPDALSRVAVLGPLADSRRDTIGPWVFDYDLDEVVTVREGLNQRLSGHAEVTYRAGLRPAQRPTPSIFDMHGNNRPVDPADFDDDTEFAAAVELARSSDVAVVVLGEWQNMVGEQASRSSLDLPGRQLDLLQAVVATGTRVVLIVLSGRPVDLRWAVEHVGAVLHVWYPGTRGGTAVAGLLCGDVSPGGKLPFTWPRSAGHVPLIYSHLTSHEPQNQHARYWDEPSTPLFPFGHGLSYSSFDIAPAAVERDRIARGETVNVTTTVTNTGTVTADEVVQLYVHQRHGRQAHPVRELQGFRRVRVEPGQSIDVTFPLGPDQLRSWNDADRGWGQDATTVDIAVGADSTTPFTTSVTVTD